MALDNDEINALYKKLAETRLDTAAGLDCTDTTNGSKLDWKRWDVPMISWDENTTNGTDLVYGKYSYTPYPYQIIPWNQPEISEDGGFIVPGDLASQIKNLLKDTEVFEMYVYDIVLVDTKECEVIHRFENIVAVDEKMAMLEVDLKEAPAFIKQSLKKGEAKLIFKVVGGFDKFKEKGK